MTASGATRRAVLGAGAAAALGGLAGCARTDTRGRHQVTVAAFPLVDEIVRAARPAWQRLHPDVALEVVTRPYADHHTAMTTALSTAVELPDVMALESSYVGRYEQGEGLEDLRGTPYDAGRYRDRFVRYAWDQATNHRGEVVAIPTDIGPGTLLYRRDLLERAGVAPSALAPSWEAYLDAGRRIQAATGAFLIGNAQKIKDIVIRTGLQPGEGLYFDRDSRVLVQQPRFHRAFALAREVRRHGLDARVTDWSNEWAEALRRGRLSTELSGAWMVGQLAHWVDPADAGRWRAAPLPERTFVSYGGTFYAIPRHAAAVRKGLAWDLVKLLTLDRDQQLQAFKQYDAFPALVAAQDDPFFDAPMPYLGGQPARRLWRDSAARITAMEVHKQNNFAEEVVNTELGNVLDRGKPIEAALSDAARLLAQRANR